jgi:hypothetical protein
LRNIRPAQIVPVLQDARPTRPRAAHEGRTVTVLKLLTSFGKSAILSLCPKRRKKKIEWHVGRTSAHNRLVILGVLMFLIGSIIGMMVAVAC